MGMGQFCFFISYIFAVVPFPLLPLWPKYGLKPLPFATLHINWSSPKTSVGKKAGSLCYLPSRLILNTEHY